MDQLKEVILSTLEEIQESIPFQEEKEENSHKKSSSEQPHKEIRKEETPKLLNKDNFFNEVTSIKTPSSNESEVLFLNSLRERMLVLFEGFQAPNNTALEAKVDLTLNFLEYVLASIDSRLEHIKGK